MASTVAIALLALCALGCQRKPARQTEPLPESELQPYQQCKTDADCMWTTNGCCDCANGGADIAIARSQEQAFHARFDCAATPCTTMGRRPACGTGEVTCVSSRCVFQSASRAK